MVDVDFLVGFGLIVCIPFLFGFLIGYIYGRGE